ncbi:MAG TPA: HAMP domain-containing sensor histidine kinase [Acidimicrobiales bacterium]
MTLRLRLLLVLVGIVAGGLIVSDVVTYTSLKSFLGTRLNQQLRAARGPVAQALEECYQTAENPFVSPGLNSTCHLNLTEAAQVPSGTYGELRDASSGAPLAWTCFSARDHASSSPLLPSPLPVSAANQRPKSFPVSKTGCGAHTYVAVASDTASLVNGQAFVVIVAVPLTEENQTLSHLRLVEGLVSLAVLIGLGALSWWVVRRGLRPLDEMTTTAGAIASGDLSQRVPHTESHTEVGRLGVALNTMLSEIEVAFAARAASEERLRRFLADASHELRTPLTSIRGYAEIFDRGARDRPEDLALSMRHIRSEANRMSELVDDLLLLARLDRERPLAHEQVELTAVVAAAVDAARVKAPDRVVTFAPVAPVVVTGDASRLRQVADNLMANALNHTPEGTPITVDLTADGTTALLTVADRGPGIDPADRGHIFEPFHRADPSRARATGGVGLGLAIVSAIATAHGGAVGVDSEPGSGATFWVRLPAVPVNVPPPVGPPADMAPPVALGPAPAPWSSPPGPTVTASPPVPRAEGDQQLGV